MDREGGPDDELEAVREGVHLFARDIWFHAPQIVSRLVVSRVARRFGSRQVVLPPEPSMSYSYRGWSKAIFGHSHPHRLEIDDWDGGGQAPTFNADEEASRDYERRWRDNTHRYILPESYSGGSSYSIRNCTKAMEMLLSLRAASSAGMGGEGTLPLGDNSGEGTSTRVMSDVELALQEEVLRLSALVRGERDLQKEPRSGDAIIDTPADTSERDRDLAASEAARLRSEGELQTLRAEMDRLKAEACSERLVRDALEAQRCYCCFRSFTSQLG